MRWKATDNVRTILISALNRDLLASFTRGALLVNGNGSDCSAHLATLTSSVRWQHMVCGPAGESGRLFFISQQTFDTARAHDHDDRDVRRHPHVILPMHAPILRSLQQVLTVDATEWGRI